MKERNHYENNDNKKTHKLNKVILNENNILRGYKEKGIEMCE